VLQAASEIASEPRYQRSFLMPEPRFCGCVQLVVRSTLLAQTRRDSDAGLERRLKIALVSPLYEAVPPKLYGGTERIVAYLADALVDLGHDVTLFASGDAQTKARLIPAREEALRLDPSPLKSDVSAHLAMLHTVRCHAKSFDVIHFNIDPLQYPMFEDYASRTLTTLHGRLDLKDLPAVYKLWSRYRLVSISNNQRRPLPWANWAATVYHGIPTSLLQFSPRGGDYLAFLGRISPEKGPDRAIKLSQRTGMKLKIAAKVDDADRDYYLREIEPAIDGKLIEYIGEIGESEKSEFLGNAAALLFPIDWPEPFGLVMIEAMACGTPVIAWNCGSVPEVVDNDLSGFVVGSEDEAVAAIRCLDELDRSRVRGVFEKRFSSDVMARRYSTIYGHIAVRNTGEMMQPAEGPDAARPSTDFSACPLT
jgi:glycosyltransferase involved in cell wall biosynthesis